MFKRVFDFFAAFFGILFLLPFLVIVGIIVAVTSKGGVFYIQQRVGKNEVPFGLYKFRSMATGSDKKGLLTVGAKDSRVTKIGYYLRKYKLDELPQLINVLIGDMSLVGPRPEVKKYTDLYNDEQKKVLQVRPGITDYASLAYFDENELLGKSNDPEKTYIQEVMPAKLKLNAKYLDEVGVVADIKIILLTLKKIIS